MKKSLIPIMLTFASMAYATDINVTSVDSANPTKLEYVSTLAFDFKNGSESGIDNVYGSFTSRINADNSIVTVADNVHLNFTVNNSQIWSGLTMTGGSSINLTAAGGGLRLQRNESTIAGDITVQGFKRASTTAFFGGDNYAFHVNGGTKAVKFIGNSNLTQIGLNGAYNDYTRAMNRIASSVSVKTTGKLKFDDYVYLNNGAVLELSSKNSIISGAGVEKNATNVAAGLKNATSQADSTFYVVGKQNDTTLKGASVVINAFVENEIGTINAFSGSSLKLITETLKNGTSAFKINEINVFNSTATTEGASTMNSDLSLTLQLNFYESNGDNMFIGNIEELIDLADIKFQVYNHSLSKYEDGVLGENFFINDGWISRTPIVPEPAEWAMIFGAIALGFVAYRRRK
ncbi:MAG: PEP-CTERM sorting domain-containing protein [Opitutales bacterium]|nr:PEP-CTERM sorting domain-containing protein [Opitutales bacterium]